jgi:hypothetical protein
MRIEFIRFAPTVNKLFFVFQPLIPSQKNDMKMLDSRSQRKKFFQLFYTAVIMLWQIWKHKTRLCRKMFAMNALYLQTKRYFGDGETNLASVF